MQSLDLPYKKLGNMLYLLASEKTADRTAAYNQYTELKRWFVEVEFEQYTTFLDEYRKSKGVTPLREIIAGIYRELTPATKWKALDGNPSSAYLPDINDLIPASKQMPNGKVIQISDSPLMVTGEY